GFTGYSLLDDLLSGTGLRIAYSITLSIPFLGTWMAFLLFGGEFPSDQIISRLFFTHVFIVPLLIIALISVHLALIWRQKHTQFPGGGRTDRNVHGIRFWPSYATESVGLFFGVASVLTLLGGLAQVNPIWLYGPFRVANVTGPAQPDWYLGWLEGALRMFPAWEIRIGGVVVPNPFFPNRAGRRGVGLLRGAVPRRLERPHREVVRRAGRDHHVGPAHRGDRVTGGGGVRGVLVHERVPAERGVAVHEGAVGVLPASATGASAARARLAVKQIPPPCV
ncbi:MAG: cytochrome b, partial [Actinobacteria bacterium]